MWAPSFNAQGRVCQAPTRTPPPPKPKQKTIKDHNGDDVHVAWMSHPLYEGHPEKFPPFPFQVYVLRRAKATANDPELPAKFVKWIEEIGGIADPGAYCHFQFYTNRFKNVLSCIAHQRTEVQYRNRNALWPRLVTSWTTEQEDDYRGFILVIDCDEWSCKGLTFVSYDRQMLDRNDTSLAEQGMPLGSEVEMRADRCPDTTAYGRTLMNTWARAGHTWTQSDLERRNQGGFSPALYPAVDPAAHHDADGDHDDAPQIDLDMMPETSTQSETIAQPPLSPQFNRRDLRKSPTDLPDLKSDVYEDTVDWPTTSVWKASNSVARPPFSFALYLSADLPGFAPEALFYCLDRGLLKQAAWTLDVVRHVPDMQSALHHYSIEAPRRTATRTERRRRCARMLLDKICSTALPEELLQHIESFIVPPPLCDYSSPPDRLFSDIFLYLDAKHQLSGPQIIHTNLNPSPSPPLPTFTQDSDSEIPTLLLTNLQSWSLLSDELHTLWSLCSPRPDLLPQTLPHFTLSLSFPPTCTIDPAYGGIMHPMPSVHSTLTLHSPISRSITIHKSHSFAPDLWTSALEIIDLTTGSVLPSLPAPNLPIPFRKLSSWSTSPAKSFITPDHRISSILKTYHPETPTVVEMSSPRNWWCERIRVGWFEDGREYLVRVKEGGMKVPRWTWGSPKDLLSSGTRYERYEEEGNSDMGPYNLPPIPVHVENECRFTFKLGTPE